jgi:four helix bundle protein
VKGDDIASRRLDLSVACLQLAARLEIDGVGKHIGRQLVRCSTSGGANYEEARSAESSADFVHKVAIAGKEVGETTYWLLLAHRAGLSTGEEIERWIDEGRQLVRILSASARTARARHDTAGGAVTHAQTR